VNVISANVKLPQLP